MPKNTKQNDFLDTNLVNGSTVSQKLTELFDVFADAASADGSGQMRDLRECFSMLQKSVRLLTISLQKTNQPFEGSEGFEQALRHCDDFIHYYKPEKNGMRWDVAEDDVERLQSRIMLQVSLISTSAVLIIAETFFGNDDREPWPHRRKNQYFKSGQEGQGHKSDPECEHVEQLWDKITRVLNRRKRKPLPGPANADDDNCPAVDALETEVKTDLRKMMLTLEGPVPDPLLKGAPQALESLSAQNDLDLDALPVEKLLERARQREQILRSAARQNHVVQRANFQPPARVWTLHNDDKLSLSPETPRPSARALQNGTIHIASTKNFSFKLAKIESIIVDRKRKLKFTIVGETITIIQELPPKRKRHLITCHPALGDAESWSIVSFSDQLKVDIIYPKKTTSCQAIISYKFSEPDDIQLFQEIVREKRLLKTFSPTTITSSKDQEASYENLTLWKDDSTTEYTLSFCRNMAPQKPHIEFSLSILQINTTEKSKSVKDVRLDFLQDSGSPPRVSANRNQRKSVGSIDSNPSDTTIKYKERLADLIQSMRFLLIEFRSLEEAKSFRKTFKEEHDKTVKESSNTSVDYFSHATEGISFLGDGNIPWDYPQSPPVPIISGGVLSASPPNSPPASHGAIQPLFTLPKSPPTIQGGIKGLARKCSDYSVGWVCALSSELAAAMAMLDEHHQSLSDLDPKDENAYKTGSIGNYNVVLVCLPSGETGNNNAASVATRMMCSFPNLRIRLMVGVGAGVPNDNCDIRLGDVVVSHKVVQYDMGKTSRGRFESTDSGTKPPRLLLNAVSQLRAIHLINGNQISQHLKVFNTDNTKEIFGRPPMSHDNLFSASYDHIQQKTACTECDKRKLEDRKPRKPSPVIYYGTIASGNQVIRDPKKRDELRELFGAICVEMEAAGLLTMETFPCLVIRGVCDYADTHKNKEWQGYAAATAAAYAKELLLSMQNR